MLDMQPPFSVADIYTIIRTAAPDPYLQAQHNFASDVDVLALTLDGEGRNQSINGRAAIAWTVKNRQAGLSSPVDKGKPIHDICLRTWQYSTWVSGGGDDNFKRQMRLAEAVFKALPDHGGFNPAEWARFQESRYVAVGVMQGQILDPTHGSTHYLRQELYATNPPSWAAKASRTTLIEDHVFLAGVA